jgi:CubicO group peptidase (beta-lactamase class C family)
LLPTGESHSGVSMPASVMRFTLLCVFIFRVSYAIEPSPPQRCRQLNPNPASITQFYENNPTYPDPTLNPADWATGSPESQGMNSAVLNAGMTQLAISPYPFSFLVVRNNVLVFEHYLNGSQMSDANNIHSASKSLISGLVGIALREGSLSSVNQKISDILTPKFVMKGKHKRITIQNLLHMNAGLLWTEDETEYYIQREKNWVQAILDLPLRNVGREFLYDTGLSHLLSAVLTEATGMDTCAFAEKYLFDPMHITVKHWGIDPQGYYSGGYNLYLTPRDLAKLGQLYLNGGNWNGVSLIPRSWIIESTQHRIQSDHPRYHYGYLWWVTQSGRHTIYKMWGHGGQFIYVVPDLNLVFVTTADTKKEHPELDGDRFLVRYVLSAIRSR